MQPAPKGSAKPQSSNRSEIPEGCRWRVEDIYADWHDWHGAYDRLERKISRFSQLKGSLANSALELYEALQLNDKIDQLSYKVWFYASLRHDENQRDNDVDAKRQLVQILFAKARQASAWFNPELLQIPLEQLREWMSRHPELALYRFALEEIYRQQEHVLDEGGERLLSLGSRFNSAPQDAYSALTTADMRFPKITLADGSEVTVSYGQYRALLATCRQQEDRAAAFSALYGCYEPHINTYAALYGAICERDWYLAQARSYSSTLESSLHGNNIPSQVVHNLIETTRAGCEPLQRYHKLRRSHLGLDRYHLYDSSIPLVKDDKRYFYDEVRPWVIASVAPLGPSYQAQVRRAFEERWIDVYENEGKRSGAYSAPVYGVHPYMLLNYNDTLDDVFTLAHEMGHSMHTILAHGKQPFVYSGYTIFVAEVASTLNEALLLDYLLDHTDNPRERAGLLQHTIDSICGTFYTQVLFADWELAAHRLVEQGQPLTATRLGQLYRERLQTYYGDAITVDPRYALTWARIPHFFRSPFYVYQYATCFASSAQLLTELRTGDRERAVKRYLALLEAGGSDHPMTLLKDAGIDLTQAATIQAVVHQLDTLVDQLAHEIARIDEPA